MARSWMGASTAVSRPRPPPSSSRCERRRRRMRRSHAARPPTAGKALRHTTPSDPAASSRPCAHQSARRARPAMRRRPHAGAIPGRETETRAVPRRIPPQGSGAQASGYRSAQSRAAQARAQTDSPRDRGVYRLLVVSGHIIENGPGRSDEYPLASARGISAGTTGSPELLLVPDPLEQSCGHVPPRVDGHSACLLRQ